MKLLFWRVFTWYLVTSAIVVSFGLTLTVLSDPEFSFNRALSLSPGAIQTQAQEAARAWTTGGVTRLHAAFAKAVHPRFLFDGLGRELSGKSIPAHIEELVKRAEASGSIEIEMIPPKTFAALKVKADGKDFVYARELAQQQNLRLISHPLPLGVRMGFSVFTATIVCFLFARYVTAPMKSLRAATREFANGNLEVRIGSAKPFNRRDDFADLAGDFDNMAAQIQNLVNTQQNLLGDISHELRSPLTRLQLALEIARRKAGSEAQTSLNRIEQEAEKLNVLIGQILSASKTERLRPGAKKLFDLSNLVREVAADAHFEASGHDRHVLVDSNELSLVHGDRELIRSAIENVVRNAIRYTPQDTNVTIDVKRVDGMRALVTVRDEGPGVPPESLPLLFEPFYRVDDARDRDSGGAGLGLAITKHAVHVHGGTVEAMNREGGGFEVQIKLPVTVPDSPGKAGMTFRTS